MLFFNLFSLLLPACALTVSLSNVDIRKDVNGDTVNAHSGGLYRFGDMFYLYGTAYQNCTQPGPICDTSCGYFHNVFVVYTSPDLAQWTLANPNLVPAILSDNAAVEYDEVNVGYCAVSNDYVLTYWSGVYGFHDSRIGLARSPTPVGPFTVVTPITAQGGKIISDTVGLFVDDDGTAYVRYNTRDAPLRHVVEKLTPDWSATTGESAIIFSKQDFPWYDGGGMFTRNGVYYVMLSFDCCFCQWGSDALVFVAPSPLGPWAPQSPSALRTIRDSLSPSTTTCDLSGSWSGSLGGAPIVAPNLFLAHNTATNIIKVTGAVITTAVYFPSNSSIVFNNFPGYAPPLVGTVGAYAPNASSDACSQLSWLPPYTPPNSFWCRYPTCHVAPVPPANWTNEVNFCGDGQEPPRSVADMTINPCSQFDVNGVNFTIPAQQFSVSTLRNSTGGPAAILYFGERFRSTPNGAKSDDFQYWAPLSFTGDALDTMRFLDNYTLVL